MRTNTELWSSAPDKFSETTMAYSSLTKQNNNSLEENIRNSIISGIGVTTKECIWQQVSPLYELMV
ncbi:MULTISPECIES: hypothetical protein [unclassified Nostoc]|uniref:hypothetical protein n=1 Tax=unclassified Nostoc TaxID=2593658 RepID=UPI0025EF9FA4|nr:hypothetical protein [Nostoc sp. JL31]MBN3891330.1 hypothetical protein [Nostoc sp. JL31]